MSVTVSLTEESEKAIFEQIEQIGRRAIEHVTRELYEPSSRYVNQLKLMKMFNIGDKQIIEWRRQGLKRVKIGRAWCYDLQDVYEIINKNKQ